MLVAETISHTPTRHVVGLRHGIHLHGVLLCARNLQNAWRPVPVVRQLGVSKVVDDVRAVFAREIDNFSHVIEIDADRSGIVWERDEYYLRLLTRSAEMLIQFGEKRSGIGQDR